MESQTVSEEMRKPVPDEQTLANLLEAAYVLQEHNREMQKRGLHLAVQRDRDASEQPKDPIENLSSPSQVKSSEPAPADYAFTLGKIVETQHHIQVRRLDLESALNLVTERVMEMSRASGAAIGMVDGNTVRYRAVAGQSAPSAGFAVPVHRSPLVSCLKTGQVFRCADVQTESLPDADECKHRGIRSLIAAPVFHDGRVAGGLEVYYSSPNAFRDQDVHTCQLMTGLVTEVLMRQEEAAWKKSLAMERAAMLEALEKLQPNLAALVETPAVKSAPAAESSAAAPTYSCGKCGHALVPTEQFCGQCGTPRASDYEAPNLQSKVASFWHMQESQKKASPEVVKDGEVESPAKKAETFQPESRLAHSLKRQLPDLLTAPDLELSDEDIEGPQIPARRERKEIVEVEGEELTAGAEEEDSPDMKADSQALVKPELTHRADWSSAASARKFLEQLASNKRAGAMLRLWNTRRGDIYLAIAIILVACVLRWGIWSDHSARAIAAPATAHATQRPAPSPGLSFFDRVLIQLGLAEAPDPPEDQGSPGVQVWVDLHTALYYCPGTDLYGKTPTGKFTTQHEARLDQFEPAYRKACN